MRMLYATTLLLVAAAASYAAPPEVPAELSTPAGKVKEFTVKVPAGKKLEYRLVGGNAAFRGFPGDVPDETVFWIIPETDGPLWIVWWYTGERGSKVTEVNKGKAPPEPAPPPKPKPDKPDEPDVKPPEPLASFRVILVYESEKNLTSAQNAVIYGKAVEEYLNANCTGGKNGWRRREQNSPGENDPTMAALWESVRPGKLPDGRPDPNRITVVPCAVMERNGRVEIVNLDPSPAKMVDTFTRFRGK